MPHSDGGFADDNERAFRDVIGILTANTKQTRSQIVGTHVGKAEQDHAGQRRFAYRHQVAEIQVSSKQDTLFDSRLLQDIAVGKTMEIFITEMNSIVSLFSKSRDGVGSGEPPAGIAEIPTRKRSSLRFGVAVSR